MARRSFKGHVAHCSTGLLRFLNIMVALGSVPILVLVFVIKPSPTPAGWGIIIAGAVALLSGLLGTCTVNQPGCFFFHAILIFLSMAGLGAFSIVIFVNTGRMMEILEPTVTNPPPETMVKALGVCCLAVMAFQILVLVLGCMVNTCGLTDYYEDLEATKGPSAKDLAKQQREDEQRKSKIEASSAHQLAVKMKEKYGQFQVN